MSGAQRGFTLIETMVAILLMAIVSLIAWRGLDSVSRADQHLRASAEHTETILRVLNQLERDLSLHASIELGVPNLTRYSEPARTLPTITLRGAHPQRFRLDVIRSAAQPEQGLLRVRWWLAGQTLYRAAAPSRSHYPLPPPDQGVAVLDKVSDVQVRVWEPGQGWHPLSGMRQDDPVGLEITLTRQAAQGAEQYRHVIGPLNE